MVALEIDAAGMTRAALKWEEDIKSKALGRFESGLPTKIEEALTNAIKSTR